MFEFMDDPQLLEVHVYETYNYGGTVTESEGKMSPVLVYLFIIESVLF